MYGLSLHNALYHKSLREFSEEIELHVNLPEVLLSRHSGAKCTHEGQEAGLSHVGGTQLRKPTVWGLLRDLRQIT